MSTKGELEKAHFGSPEHQNTSRIGICQFSCRGFARAEDACAGIRSHFAAPAPLINNGGAKKLFRASNKIRRTIMTRREHIRVCISIFLTVMRPALDKNYILFTRIRVNRNGALVGKGIRICKNDDCSNTQMFTTYTYISDLDRNFCRLTQFNYRFVRKSLRNVYPHPAFLAG